MKKTLIILLLFIPGLIFGQKFPNLAPTYGLEQLEYFQYKGQ